MISGAGATRPYIFILPQKSPKFIFENNFTISVKNNYRKYIRRSTRLKGYNYSKAGKYYVTINCHGKEFIFGNIIAGKMQLNEFGTIAENEWKRTALLRKHIELGEFIIMPDHIHGVVIITKNLSAPLQKYFSSPSRTLGAIVRGYMSTVTSQINKIRNTPGEKVWQRGYHDHIIRNKWDLDRISRYIRKNPRNWLRNKDP